MLPSSLMKCWMRGGFLCKEMIYQLFSLCKELSVGDLCLNYHDNRPYHY